MSISRRIIPLIVAMTLSVFIATGVAVAATIKGGDGNNNITGTNTNDKLYGGNGHDKISGLAGSDDVRGQNGNDTLFGTDENMTPRSGNDGVYGGYGQDTLLGGSGADTLGGGPGNDTIVGGPHDDAAVDTINGSDGDDAISTFTSPAGKDVITCGAGIDNVAADFLDEVAADCENVERIPDEEPQLDPNTTYSLNSDPSSECDLGEGTLNVATDPETGERGVEIEFAGAEIAGDIQTAANEPQACDVSID